VSSPPNLLSVKYNTLYSYFATVYEVLVMLFLSPEYPVYCHAGSGIDKIRYYR